MASVLRRIARAIIVLLAMAPLFGVLLDPATTVSAAGPTVSISPASKTVKPGESFELQVTIESDIVTRGVEFGLKFDPAVVQVDKVTEGGYYKDWAKGKGGSTMLVGKFAPDNSKGTVSVGGIAVMGGGTGQGPTGSGTLATIQMTAKPSASGRSSVEITDLGLSDANAQTVTSAHAVNGEVIVGSGQAVVSTSPTRVDTTRPSPAAQPSATSQPTSAPTPPRIPVTPTIAPTVAAIPAAAPAVPAPVATRPPSMLDRSAPGLGSRGLLIPWETIGGFGGAVVVAGLVAYAFKK